MRLRNRQIKASWYTDPGALRWSRDKRLFYLSLWALAEDSACMEDDMFGVKVAAWVSPLDADMTLDRFETWRLELIAERDADGVGKLVPYEANGRKCLYLPTMAQHEKPRNPQSPDTPLPSWVKWKSSLTDSRKGGYEHNRFELLEYVQRLYNGSTTLPVLSCPALSCPELPCVQPSLDSAVDNPAAVDNSLSSEEARRATRAMLSAIDGGKAAEA